MIDSPQIFTDSRGLVIKKPKSAKIHWRISAYAYIQREDRILMIRDHASKQWELPGGGINADEWITEGLVRECYEETGYRVKVIGEPIHFIERHFYSKFFRNFFHTFSIIYKVHLESTKQNKKAINSVYKGEILEVAWQPIKKLTKLDCHPMFHQFIKMIK